MQQLPVVDLNAVADELAESGQQVKVLWQEPGSLAFVARGRDYRSEFHVNASDEVTYMIRGTMNLHYRDADGNEDIVVIPAGASNWMPPNTEHSPRFPSDAYALILERGRQDGEVDHFRWYCPDCGELVHQEDFTVDDYTKDPVSKAYRRFFDSLQARTCGHCGAVIPSPDDN